jgi:hypothetical protein
MMTSGRDNSNVVPLNCADLGDERGSVVNLLFHGFFGFLISPNKNNILVSAPVVTDHVCAVRLSTPTTGTGDIGLPLPIVVPQNGLEKIDLVMQDTSKASLDTSNVVRLKPPQDTVWSPGGSEAPYVSFTAPYPNCIRVYRPSQERIKGGFIGNDVAGEDKDPNGPGKQYAIVHRFSYRASPQTLKINVNYSFGTVNITNGLSLPQVSVHFYAQELFQEDHDMDEALKQLKKIYSPTPDIQLTTNLNGTVVAAADHEGLAKSDEEDLRELLNITEHSKLHRVSVKLRNCLSVYLDNSDTRS